MSTTNGDILNSLNKAREPRPRKEKNHIPVYSAKRKAKETDVLDMLVKDKKFYLSVWANAPHICYECGIGLGKTVSHFNFHHLLEKSRYPEFRHVGANIVLTCLECHSKVHTNIHFAPRIEALTAEAHRNCLNWIDDVHNNS